MSVVQDVYIVYSDARFLEAVRRELARLDLGVLTFDHFEPALESLRTSQPRLLILEWNLRDLAAIDFLIRVSEDKSWGEMTVFFVCSHEMEESEVFQMATLGTDHCYRRDDLLACPHFTGFLDDIEVALSPTR